MKHAFEKVLLLLLICCLLVSTAGCSGLLRQGQPQEQQVSPDEPSSNTETPRPTVAPQPVVNGLNPNPPASPVRLVFIHHSVGEQWLNPERGDLLRTLNDNSYYVTDTNYDWGPADVDAGTEKIGDHTDIGYWYSWFLGPHRDTYTSALYANDHLTDMGATNSIANPGGENTVIVFKSCFISGQTISGNPGDKPLQKGQPNPIYGVGSGDEATYTVANIKGMYRDLLDYFSAHPDKMFVLITTPPSRSSSVSRDEAARLRAINTWLVNDWLKDYSGNNVVVFDYYNVLTASSAHDRYVDGRIEYVKGSSDFLAYPSEDDHPNAEGQKKATAEFVPLLNIAYHKWADARQK